MLTSRKAKDTIKKKKYPPLPANLVLDIVRRCTTDGQLTWKPHFKKRMEQRRISISDVLNTIDTGRISKPAEWNDEHGEYNYFITGKDIEGEELTLKIAIADDEEMTFLITIY
jgi:hypothetical protein